MRLQNSLSLFSSQPGGMSTISYTTHNTGAGVWRHRHLNTLLCALPLIGDATGHQYQSSIRGYTTDDFPITMLKVLLYLGNGTDDYTDWGTKLYTEENNIDSFEKEIEFNPGTCFLFEANKYSYHGTQFDNGINGYRFCLMGEYVDN